MQVLTQVPSIFNVAFKVCCPCNIIILAMQVTPDHCYFVMQSDVNCISKTSLNTYMHTHTKKILSKSEQSIKTCIVNVPLMMHVNYVNLKKFKKKDMYTNLQEKYFKNVITFFCKTVICFQQILITHSAYSNNEKSAHY